MSSGEEESEARIRPDILQTAYLSRIAKSMKNLDLKITVLNTMVKQQIPMGIIEPLNQLTVTNDPVVVHPPFRTKYWFSVTIVKLDAVELHLNINTENETQDYTMGAAENVYDQNFNVPCIQDIKFWTDTGVTCRVKVRGTR